MIFYDLISQFWAPNKRLKVFLATSQRYRHHISKLLRCGRRSTLTTEKEVLCYGLQIIIMTKNWQPLYLMNVSCVFVFFFSKFVVIGSWNVVFVWNLSYQSLSTWFKQHDWDNTNLELTKRFTPFLYLINCSRNIVSDIFSLIV